MRKKKHLKQYRACWESDWCPESPRFTSERRRRKHYYTDEWIKDIRLTWTASLDPTSEVCQSGGQAIGMWETHGLMTRIDKAYFTTICNRKLCSSIALTKEKLHMSLAPRLITGDAAEKVESSLCMWAVRESMPRISNFSEEPGNQKKKYGKLFCYTKTRHGFVRPMCKRKHLKQYRACWESTNRARNRQGLPQKDVGGNITILTSESKTSDWHKQFMWTPPARYVNREGKRLACEKHMDWWPASTKPLLQPYAI